MTARRSLSTVALALAFAGFLPAGEGDGSPIEQPPRGTCEPRPELAGVHPRLYFTREDLPRLRRLARGGNRWFVERAKETWRGYVGQDRPGRVEGWKRYLYGFWALSAMDLLYAVEGDPVYADTARNWVAAWLAEDDWGGDDLIPMDILAGVALTYDILHDRFAPAERADIRRRLHAEIEAIRRRFFVGQYWTADYQNNHMHNRVHGMATAAFAILGDDPELDAQPAADLALDSIRRIAAWLPDDGSNHEGPGYWSYGHHWAVRAMYLAAHVTGEDPAAGRPHFAAAHRFRIHLTAPGWRRSLNIGDGGDGPPGNLTALCPSIARAGDAAAEAVLRRLMEVDRGEFYQHAIWGLLWHDPALEPGRIADLPLWCCWPDLGMFSIRSSWEDDATAFVFKCGPLGGHRLQRLRGDRWANVAHDHPDQNHFLLFAHGRMLAEDDGYPKRRKLTRSHNTVTVDGRGQPREGSGWSQPFAYERSGRLADRFLVGATAFATGDASRLYEGAERCVRHVAFVRGGYPVLLDELIGAGGERRFEWRLHKDGAWRRESPRHFRVVDEGVGLGIRFLLPGPAVETEDRFLPAEGTAKPCLAFAQAARRTRFLAVLVPEPDGRPAWTAQLVPGDRGVAVRVGIDGREDLVAVADPGAEDFAAGEIRGRGRAAILSRRGEAVELALVVRGRSLHLDGALLLGAGRAANLARRVEGRRLVVTVEPPYRAEAGRAPVALAVGGLPPRRRCRVAVDDDRPSAERTDAAGVLELRLPLDGRHRVRVAY